jgi:hypothetical protein
MKTIIGQFETRRQAELAVEHCVQEYGIDRADIFIQPAGEENSAGSRLAGADAESGHPGVDKRGNPALEGSIEVSAEVDDRSVDEVCAAFRELDARDVQCR